MRVFYRLCSLKGPPPLSSFRSFLRLKSDKMSITSTQELAAVIASAARSYPKNDKYIAYGTAGFRTKADHLEHVMFRVGVIAALRSKDTKSTIGVMVTASHNPEEDNGVKIVDPKGEMLDPSWEQFATDFANVQDTMVEPTILSIMEKVKLDVTTKGQVYVGRDSRASSPRLTQIVIEGIMAVEGVDPVDFGVVHTPMIHYLVYCKNDGGVYGKPTIEGYYEKLIKSFQRLVSMDREKLRGDVFHMPELTIDGSCGVGAVIAKKLFGELKLNIRCTIINEEGVLNEGCGADFVKVNQCAPKGVTPSDNMRKNARFASIDGDADRVIYFYFADSNNFCMLDGDKIALLFAEHLSTLVKRAELNLTLGLVQTAYANGSSTWYATDVLGIPVSCTPTGIKHLHHAALQYDIGVYFEANGHGTVVFSEKAVKQIKTAAANEKILAAVELRDLMNVLNSTVGDALSDILAVEAILFSKKWSVAEWNKMYEDLPNRQLKVKVDDRSLVQTADAERIVTQPVGLQKKIDALVSQHINGRAFVRPSGTEDIVRVYAEAAGQKYADQLANDVADAVRQFCCSDAEPKKAEGVVSPDAQSSDNNILSNGK